MNRVVPKAYCRRAGAGAQAIGHTNYKISNEPRDILAQLHNIYGCKTPAEKEANNTTFNMAWIHATNTIKVFLSRLEDCYIYTLRAKPAITMEQLIDKAVTGVQLTGLYPTAMLE